MRIIDAHVHVLDNYRPMEPFADAGRVDRLLHHMDECGVEKAIMLPVVADFSPDNNQECARWAAEHPDRLAAMTDVPLHAEDAASQVARARERYSAVAISYYPNTADIAWMLEEKCASLWEAFAASKLPCNLQVTPPNYATLLELARRHPQVTFLCNHLALPRALDPGDSTYGGLAGAADLANVFVKISAFYAATDTPWDFRCPRALGYFAALLKILGPERLLWGTDWPPTSRHLTYRQALEIVRSAAGNMDAKARAQVLGENAARLFHL